MAAVAFDGAHTAEKELSALRTSREDPWLTEVAVLELMTGRYKEQVTWRDAATGRLLAESDFFEKLSPNCLITPGYGGRVYSPRRRGSSPCRCGRPPAASSEPPIPIQPPGGLMSEQSASAHARRRARDVVLLTVAAVCSWLLAKHALPPHVDAAVIPTLVLLGTRHFRRGKRAGGHEPKHPAVKFVLAA